MARAAGDRDSRLGGARLVGLPTNISGRVGRTDLDDLLRFTAPNGRSSFTLNLSGIAKRNNIDVELYRFVRPVNEVLRSIGKLNFRQIRGRDRNRNFQLVAASRSGGNRNESLTVELNSTAEAPGEFFVRVLRRQGNNSRYVMTLEATPVATPLPTPGVPVPGVPSPDIPPTPGVPSPSPGVPSPTPGVPSPSPIPVPTPVPGPPPITINTVQRGTVSNGDPEDRYELNITTAGDYLFTLSGMTADADLEVRSGDGNTVLRASRNTGGNPERLIQPFDVGKYIVRVFQKPGSGATTNYSLNIGRLTDGIGNTEATARDLGTLGSTPVTQSNYVVTAGKDSPVDFVKFKLPGRGFLTVELTGRPADGGRLFGNLDVDVYAAGQLPSEGLVAATLGTESETFGGTLAGGPANTYYVRVRPQDNSVEGSTYNLRLKYDPRGPQPSITRDIRIGDSPENSSSEASNLTEVNGLAYFTAEAPDSQGVLKRSLWLSNGTLNGTKRLFDFDPGVILESFTKVGGALYFVANANNLGKELWTSDGTTSGTRLVTDLVPGSVGSNPKGLTAVGNDLYFYTEPTAGSGLSPKKLYRLRQGTFTPTEIVSDQLEPLSEFNNFMSIGNTLYFTADTIDGDTELWRAVAGPGDTVTLEVMDLNPDASSAPSNLTNAGNVLFLTANVKVGGGIASQRELVRIDQFGSSFTRFNLNDDSSSNPGNLLYFAGGRTLYFTALDRTNGTELWRLTFANNPPTDNAPAPTPQLVRDIASGSVGSNPSNLVNLGGRLAFIANDGSGAAIWISGGTAATTQKLSSITGLDALATVTNPQALTVVNGSLFFVGTTEENGTELWRVTPAAPGQPWTARLFDIRVGPESSFPLQLNSAQTQLFFVADDGITGKEVWSVV
ncbi:MAG: hypothetical protein IGS38_12945 [Synechococcales cyanobacterium M58_A2018_015]|nr:hypothetical protein [Synechococcales cyanobacterium M58_A2018_015]